MVTKMKKLILASRSQRRRMLMSYLASDFLVKPIDVDETLIQKGISNEDQAFDIAKKKAELAFEKYPDTIVIGAYTIVDLFGVKLGKPKNDEDAARMLRLLRGKTHNVITAVYVKSAEKDRYFFCNTEVTFEFMSDEEIEYYVNTGEGHDKAGAYAIQGLGSRYITKINGDFYNVLGLPIYQLYHLLKEFE